MSAYEFCTVEDAGRIRVVALGKKSFACCYARGVNNAETLPDPRRSEQALLGCVQ